MNANKGDSLGSRMKEFYENRTRISLPRRTYTIIRIDGKAFHTYTKGLDKPFDDGFMNDMDETACYLCENIQGAKFGFIQSDEISILLTDFDKIGTDAWFDGNIQKMVSVAASMATSKFNQLRMLRAHGEMDIDIEAYGIIALRQNILNIKLAEFDARVFTIPSPYEVANYFVWRQKDAVRNSISSVAQRMYSHKELENKNSDEKQEMIFQKGINWNHYLPKYKRGRFVFKQEIEVEANKKLNKPAYIRTNWIVGDCPIFTQKKEFLLDFIPKNE